MKAPELQRNSGEDEQLDLVGGKSHFAEGSKATNPAADDDNDDDVDGSSNDVRPEGE